MNNASVDMKVYYLFENLIFFLLDVYPEVELLGHIVILFLTLGGAPIWFSIIAAPLHIHTNGI